MQNYELWTIAVGKKYWEMANLLAISASKFDIQLNVVTKTGENPPLENNFKEIHYIDESLLLCKNKKDNYKAWELKLSCVDLSQKSTANYHAFVDADSLVIKNPIEMWENVKKEKILTTGARYIKTGERWCLPGIIKGSTIDACISLGGTNKIQTLNGGILVWERGDRSSGFYSIAKEVYSQAVSMYNTEDIRDELVWAITFSKMGIDLPRFDSSNGIWDASNVIIDIEKGITRVKKSGYWEGYTSYPPIIHYGSSSKLLYKHAEEIAYSIKDKKTKTKPTSYSISLKEADFLKRYVKNKNIKTILEVGPGLSTSYFIDAGMNITSIETNEAFAKKWTNEFVENENCQIIFSKDFNIKGSTIKDSTIKDFNNFDFGFVDGPAGHLEKKSREKACVFVSEHCNRWFLHDANRKDERLIIDDFKKSGKWFIRPNLDFPKIVEFYRIESLPFISCICTVNNNSNAFSISLLSEVIQSFLRQDYPKEKRELIILSNNIASNNIAKTEQLHNQPFDGCKIVNITKNFITDGEKRNAAHGLSNKDTSIYAVINDNNILLPQYFTELFMAIDNENDFVIPDTLYKEVLKDGIPLLLKIESSQSMCSGAFTKDSFIKANGYPIKNNCNNNDIFNRIKKNTKREGIIKNPSYIYKETNKNGK